MQHISYRLNVLEMVSFDFVIDGQLLLKNYKRIADEQMSHVISQSFVDAIVYHVGVELGVLDERQVVKARVFW